MDEQMYERLRALTPIAALEGSHRDTVIRQGAVVSLGAGAFLFRQGESDDRAFFLLEGEVETLSENVRVRQLRGGDRAAREELGAGDPRPVSVRALGEVRVFVVSRAVLGMTEVLSDPDRSPRELPAGAELEPFDWMSHLLRSELFKRIPVGNVHRIITLMESIAVRPGDVIIRQGNVGDYFYYIKSGQAEVTRRVRPHAPPLRLAVRGPGESFGEEALASDAERNATVTMLSDGELLRLSKKSFIELIRKPALNSVSYGQAQMLVRGGAHWLDVRFLEDHERSGIEGSINLPLDEIRTRASGLDRVQRYVVYCDTGRESSAAAFLLTELGFDVCYLAGGLLHALASVRSGPLAPAAEPAGGGSTEGEEDAAPAAVEPRPLGLPVAGEETIPPPEAVASARVHRLVNQLAEVKTQLLASMRLKAMAEEAHLGAERALTAKLAELRSALATQVERAEALAQRLEQTEAARRSARERASRAVTALGQRAARARRLESDLARAGARVRQLEAALDSARSERDALERQVKERDGALDAERARFAQELERMSRLREDATEQLQRERHSMNVASREVDRQLELALRLRSEAEAAMQAAVQLVKERGARAVSKPRGTGFRIVGSLPAREDGD